MLLGRPVKRWPRSTLAKLESKPFQDENPEKAVIMHGLGGDGSGGCMKLSGSPAVRVRSGGPRMCDFTMTRNEHVARMPQMFVAVQVTTLVPAGNVVPEGGT